LRCRARISRRISWLQLGVEVCDGSSISIRRFGDDGSAQRDALLLPGCWEGCAAALFQAE